MNVLNIKKFDKKQQIMWGLNCKYYTKTFNSLDELIEDIMSQEWIQIMKQSEMEK